MEFQRFRSLLYYILLVPCVLLFFSCSNEQDKETDIVGEWELVWIAKNDSNIVSTWTFADDYSLTVNNSKNNIVLTSDAGAFNIDKKSFDGYYLNITEIDYWIDGQYKILTLNKEILILQLTADGSGKYSFGRFEFIRR